MSNEERAKVSSLYIDDLATNSDWSPEQRWHQWMNWQDSFDQNCPPDAPYQAEDGSGCVEKPDNSNYSDAQLGRPSPGGGGGGGGGGRGGGRGGGGGTGFNSPIYDYLKGQAMDPKQWLNTFLGQGGMNQYQQSVDQQRQYAMTLQEPQRSAMLARINEGTLGATRQQAEASRMGMLSGSLMPQEYGWGQLDEQRRQANQQNALGWGNIGLGYGNLGLAQQQFGWESGSKWSDTLAQNQLDRENQLKLAEMQVKAGQPSKLQKGLQVGGTVVAAAGTVAALL